MEVDESIDISGLPERNACMARSLLREEWDSEDAERMTKYACAFKCIIYM